MKHVMARALVPSMMLVLAGGAAVAACVDDSSPPATSPASFDASIDTLPAADARTPDDARAPEDAALPDVVDAAVVSADLALDFSNTANPNGAWTFGYTSSSPEGDAGALIPLSMEKEPSPGIHLWFDPTNVNLDAPGVYHNQSNAAYAGVAVGEVALHPGNAGEYAIARWTAPVAGTYAVKVQFKEGDIGDTNGLLLHDGVVLVNEASTATNAVHDLTVTLAAGDTLEVAVGSKGDFLYDSTPVIFSIHSIP